MHRGKPCFEWSPGVEIEDIFEEKEDWVLEIANEIEQVVDQEEVQKMIELPFVDEKDKDKGEQLGPDIQDNEEGVIIVEEDNIVREEESFV